MHDVILMKTRIGACYNLKMQGLNNGYAQLLGGRLEGGGKDDATSYIINHLICTIKSQHLQCPAIEQISQ